MLSKLLQIGQRQYQFVDVALNAIPKGCCSNVSEVVCSVVDFDQVKDALKSHTPPKSCDAIKVCDQYNRIDFIELKGFKQYKKYNPNVTEADIQDQVIKFNFEKKIEDSYFVLTQIVTTPTFTLQEIADFTRISSRYFVVSDISLDDGLMSFTASLNFLASNSNIDRQIKTAITNQLSMISNTFLTDKPRLCTCQQICEIICENNCCIPATSLN